MRSMIRVSDVVQETPSTVTLRFDYEPSSKPGQFVMVWLPGDDEVPMSLSYVRDGERKGITVKIMGSTSRNMNSLRVGDLVGIRGPYGNHFDVRPRRILLVAGGSGAAVLAPAAEAARLSGAKITTALGATTETELLFRKRLETVSDGGLQIATDDGSAGERGYVTNLLPRILKEEHYDALWTCGPEVMMLKALKAADHYHVPFTGSIERVMKCALNICDACALDSYHVCTDGPVFTGDILRECTDFGHFKRDMSGRRVPV